MTTACLLHFLSIHLSVPSGKSLEARCDTVKLPHNVRSPLVFIVLISEQCLILLINTEELIRSKEHSPNSRDAGYQFKLLHLVIDDQGLRCLGALFALKLSPQERIPGGNSRHFSHGVMGCIDYSDS